MLSRPERGFARSVEKINVDTGALADWIEASCFLLQERVTKSDIVDILIEEQICDAQNQELAREIADRGFEEVQTRLRYAGASGLLTRSGDHLQPDGPIEESPFYAFLLALSVSRIYPDWAKDVSDHSYQGELFERAIEAVCPGLLPGWTVYRAGWSPENAVSIPSIVDSLCPLLNTRGHPALEDWVPDRAKDGGLDIVCYRAFRDNREALPSYFVQCASGANWRDKVATPNADEWTKYLDAAVAPSTAIAAPFVIDEKELRLAGLKGQITVFDRTRLLQAYTELTAPINPVLEFDILGFVAAYSNNLPLNI